MAGRSAGMLSSSHWWVPRLWLLFLHQEASFCQVAGMTLPASPAGTSQRVAAYGPPEKSPIRTSPSGSTSRLTVIQTS